MVMYRSRKLLDSARDMPCTWPLTHNCAGDVVAAHSNQLRDGHGRSIKAHDYRIAYLCCAAHFDLDQGSKLTKQERREGFDEAHRVSVGLMFERGVVKVA
jgi:hypothetical protein